MIRFAKYEALGNAYIVLECDGEVDAQIIGRLCDDRHGLGGDGILIPFRMDDSQPGVRVLNPDGSEAEISGNGVRIFARYLWDQGAARAAAFEVTTATRPVLCEVSDNGRVVSARLGRASFCSANIPVTGPPREVLEESMVVAGQSLGYSAVNIGNPHCVLLRQQVSEEETRRLGPMIETDGRFPNRTNVQFVRVLSRDSLQIEIWERGAGRTLSSGSSSAAAAAVAHRLGFCNAEVTVHMPGGQLQVRIEAGYEVVIRGPVAHIASGEIAPETMAAENSGRWAFITKT